MKTLKPFRHFSERILPVLLVLLFAFSGVLKAADPNLFEVWNFDRGNDGAGVIPGRLFVPPHAIANPNQKFPIVIFYHGQAERGTNNTDQVNGNIDYLFARAVQTTNPDLQFFLYAPQLTSGEWGQSYVDDTLKAVAKAMGTYNIDPSRAYITGISWGGAAVRYAIGHYADIYAAAVPICGVGGGNVSEHINAFGKHVWQFHAVGDGPVSVSTTRNHINAIRQAAGQPQVTFPVASMGFYQSWENKRFLDEHNMRYTEDQQGHHWIWDQVYNDDRLYEWLFEKSVDPFPAIDESVHFDLGATVLSGTDTQGRRWNSTVSLDHQTLNGVVQFGRKSSGSRTSVGLTVVQSFGSATSAGLTSSSFHDNVARDGWLTAANVTETSNTGLLRIGGLTPSGAYRVEIFASHSDNDGGNGRISQYKIGTQVVELNAVINTNNLAVFTEVTADSKGTLDLKVFPKAGTTSRFGQINALTVKRIQGTSGPVNQEPVVDAGSNQTITLPATVTLNGTVTDDGLPSGSTLSYQWTKVSGPGTVSFSNATAAQTTGTFSQSGTYVLELAASDTLLSGSHSLTVTVNPSLPPPMGGTLFFQDFAASASVGSYVSAGSAGPNLLNDISPQTGTNAWVITGGKLTLAQTNETFCPGFARHTDLPGDPKFVLLEFDYSMSGFSTWSASALLYLGQFSATPNYTANWFHNSTVGAKVEIKGYGTSGYSIHVGETSTGEVSNASVAKKLSFYINKTGTSQNYMGPDGVAGRTLSNNCVSVFVADTIRINNVAISTHDALSTNLSDFFMYFRQNATYTIDNFKVVDLQAGGEGPVASDLTSEGLDGFNIGTGSGGSSQILAGGLDWQVSGSGNGLAGTTDSLHFEECGVTGNFVAVAKMKGLVSTAASARSGLMIRDSGTDPGARMVALGTTTGTQYKIAKRLTASGNAVETTPAETYAYPNAWVMLERVGDVVTSAVSNDGETFSQVDSTTLQGAPAELFTGLFTTSGTSGVSASAVLSDFDLYDSDAMFMQNFEGSTTASNYISATPGVNLLNHLNTPAGTAWSIEGGKLKLVHGGGSAGAGFTRHTDLINGTHPAPSFVAVEFDFTFQTSVNWNWAMNFAFGQLNGAGPYGSTLGYGLMAARLSVRSLGIGQFDLCFDGASSPTYNSAQPVHVFWVINTSGSQKSYIGPDGAPHQVAHTTMDLWVNGSPVFSQVPRTAGYGYNLLQDFYVSCDLAGTYTIDNLTVRDLASP